MEWSEDKEVLKAQVKRKFKELGFEFPCTEEQQERFNKAFEGYPYKLDPKCIDPEEILNNLKKEDEHQSDELQKNLESDEDFDWRELSNPKN